MIRARLCVLLAAVLLPSGCKGGAADKDAAPGPDAVPTKPSAPGTRDGFLAELAPLPHPTLVIVYRVDGPAEISGTLELMVKRGGYRRENWTVEIPVPGGPPQSRQGTTIQAPDFVYAQTPGKGGTVSLVASPVGALADGYLALEPPRREKVIGALRKWHGDLASARTEHPGETREILGHRCLWTRVAAQSVCIWEQAGLPLRYEGDAFTVEAVRIETKPNLAENAFAVPPELADRKPGPVPDGAELDPVEALAALEAGNYAPLALALAPGFRLPTGLLSGQVDAKR